MHPGLALGAAAVLAAAALAVLIEVASAATHLFSLILSLLGAS